ncbi:MAG: potassium channel family protein [Halobacteriales archaeon]
MASIKRRAAYYVLGVAVVILVSAGVYDLGMRTFEPGRYPPPETELSFLHSLQVVVETFTATGYGSDSPWQSAEMNLLVMVLDVTGVAVFFLALPAIFLPLFRDALTPSAPTSAPADLAGHVIICTPTDRAQALVAELDAHDIPTVVLEPDPDRATALHQSGWEVINGDPESIDDLVAANLSSARALVADLADRTDASIVLAAREVDEDVSIVSVVEDARAEAYHRLAGADHVVTPRRALGESLANKLTTGIRPAASDPVELGDDLDLVEVPVHHGSPWVDRSLADLGLRERYGVNVIGAWYRGEFEVPPVADAPLMAGTVLLIGGAPARLERLRGDLSGTVRTHRRGETIILGHGVVGRTVRDALEAAEIPVTVVDLEDRPGVDVAGDATDATTLDEVGVGEASAVVITLGDDKTTQFATLVVRELSEETEVIARANTAESVRKTYRAGGDYVLSLSNVTGRSIAARILERDEILAVGTTIEVVRTDAPGLVGRTIRESRVRERTGCSIVAIERDDEILTEVPPSVRVEEDDTVVIAGTDEGTNRFAALYE